MSKKSNKIITVDVSFQIQEDIWDKLEGDLKIKGIMAQTGLEELSSIDLVAFSVLKSANIRKE